MPKANRPASTPREQSLPLSGGQAAKVLGAAVMGTQIGSTLSSPPQPPSLDSLGLTDEQAAVANLELVVSAHVCYFGEVSRRMLCSYAFTYTIRALALCLVIAMSMILPSRGQLMVKETSRVIFAVLLVFDLALLLWSGGSWCLAAFDLAPGLILMLIEQWLSSHIPKQWALLLSFARHVALTAIKPPTLAPCDVPLAVIAAALEYELSWRTCGVLEQIAASQQNRRLLGLAATGAEDAAAIKKAFKHKVLRLHPDKLHASSVTRMLLKKSARAVLMIGRGRSVQKRLALPPFIASLTGDSTAATPTWTSSNRRVTRLWHRPWHRPGCSSQSCWCSSRSAPPAAARAPSRSRAPSSKTWDSARLSARGVGEGSA